MELDCLVDCRLLLNSTQKGDHDAFAVAVAVDHGLLHAVVWLIVAYHSVVTVVVTV
jgi:hypothetical protein